MRATFREVPQVIVIAEGPGHPTMKTRRESLRAPAIAAFKEFTPLFRMLHSSASGLTVDKFDNSFDTAFSEG